MALRKRRPAVKATVTFAMLGRFVRRNGRGGTRQVQGQYLKPAKAHRENPPGLFILSARHRDALAAMAARAGWRAIAARRAKGAEQRYLASDALIALVDAREEEDAAEAVGLLAPAVEASGGALVLLLDEGREGDVPALMAAGATHYACGPLSGTRLAALLASAEAMIERLDNGLGSLAHRHAVRRSDVLFWRHDAGEKLFSLSPPLADLLGLPRGAVRPAQLLRRLPRGKQRHASAVFDRALAGGTPAVFAHDLSGRPGQRVVHHLHREGDALVGEVELLPGTRRERPEQADALTGLANRQGAVAWIDEALQADGSLPIALLLSVSRFDRTNAAYGDAVGDALLARIARRLERLTGEIAGPDALLARVAGADFLVGLSAGRGDVELAQLLARQLVAAVGRPFSAEDHVIRLTARCGIAEALPGDDPLRLLRRAGQALADAKQSGGEGIRLLTTDRRSREIDSDRLEADLRLALDRGEIDVLFQPQYRTADDALVGVEALARWRHPDYGPLGAAVLFGAAERSDYMLPLSAHIHAEALRLAAEWSGALAGIRLSINATAADIAQPDFLPRLLALVDGHDFPRGRLTVEVTEGGLIDDLASTSALLQQLRDAGLAVAVDDFGTGYSSLAYLKSLPLDYIKIDSGFAQDITGSVRDRIIVRGVVQLARSLELQVIAEGVETEEQRAALAAEGCEIYQGFLRSKAVSSEELSRLAARAVRGA